MPKAKRRSLDELKALFRQEPPDDPDYEEPEGEWVMTRADDRMLSDPRLVFFVFQEVLGFRTYGPYEKMRIGVSAFFKDVPFAFQWQKFGLRLYLPKDKAGDVKFARTVQAAVREILREIRGPLQKLGQQQIDAGNVTLENKYDEFEGNAPLHVELRVAATA